MVFTTQSYARVVYAVALHPSVHLSVHSSQAGTAKTAKHRITQTVPHNSPGILVFWCQWSWRNSNRVTLNRGAK